MTTLPPPLLYPTRDLGADRQLADAYLRAWGQPGSQQALDARAAMLDYYRPARLAQMDLLLLSSINLDVNWAWLTRLRLWIRALPSDLVLRAPRLGLDNDTVDRLGALAAAHAEHADAASAELTDRNRVFFDELLGRVGEACEAELTPRVAAALRGYIAATRERPSGERIAGAARCALTNVLLMLLDSPATALPASHAAYAWAAQGLFPLGPAFAPADDAGVDAFAGELDTFAAQADRAQLPELGWTARMIAGSLTGMFAGDPQYEPGGPRWSAGPPDWLRDQRRVDRHALGGLDGQRKLMVVPCRDCTMPGAALAATALDPSYEALHDEERVIIPAGLNRFTCAFCGAEQTVNTPAVFYRPDRRQVIYCLPTADPQQPDEAIGRHRAAIERIRDRYLNTLTAEQAAAYQDAPELLTFNWEQFMYAVQTGNTIPEDHAYTGRVLDDGTVAILDPTKRFIRYLTPAEAAEIGLHAA